MVCLHTHYTLFIMFVHILLSHMNRREAMVWTLWEVLHIPHNTYSLHVLYSIGWEMTWLRLTLVKYFLSLSPSVFACGCCMRGTSIDGVFILGLAVISISLISHDSHMIHTHNIIIPESRYTKSYIHFSSASKMECVECHLCWWFSYRLPATHNYYVGGV